MTDERRIQELVQKGLKELQVLKVSVRFVMKDGGLCEDWLLNR